MKDLHQQVTEQVTANPSKDSLSAALQALGSDCDGAHSRDGVGFNRDDADFAEELMAVRPEKWTKEDREELWKMLRKYRRQLLDNHGIEYDGLSPLAPEILSQDEEVFS